MYSEAFHYAKWVVSPDQQCICVAPFRSLTGPSERVHDHKSQGFGTVSSLSCTPLQSVQLQVDVFVDQ
jgi:hypothetical protein